MNGNGAEPAESAYRHEAGRTADQLDQAQLWLLDRAGLRRLDNLLTRIEAAVEARDAGTIATARGDLVQFGAVRLTGIGDAPSVPPADLPLERINELVHRLRGDARPTAPDHPRGEGPGHAAHPTD